MKPWWGSSATPRQPWAGGGILPPIQASCLRHWHWRYVEIAELLRRKARGDVCVLQEVLTVKRRSKIRSWFFSVLCYLIPETVR